mgnify:CR=1 FL=1
MSCAGFSLALVLIQSLCKPPCNGIHAAYLCQSLLNLLAEMQKEDPIHPVTVGEGKAPRMSWISTPHATCQVATVYDQGGALQAAYHMPGLFSRKSARAGKAWRALLAEALAAACRRASNAFGQQGLCGIQPQDGMNQLAS